MAEKIYIGVDGKAREVDGLYVGVGGVARRVSAAYIGVNGKAQLCYKDMEIVQIPYTNNSYTWTGSTYSPTWINYDPEKMTMSGTTSSSSVGTHYVTFVPKDRYCWPDGTQTPQQRSWYIGYASNYISLSTTSLSVDYNTPSKAFTASSRDGTGMTVSIVSGSEYIQVSTSRVSSGGSVTVTGVATGSARIKLYTPGDSHHSGATAYVDVTTDMVFPYRVNDLYEGGGQTWRIMEVTSSYCTMITEGYDSATNWCSYEENLDNTDFPIYAKNFENRLSADFRSKLYSGRFGKVDYPSHYCFGSIAAHESGTWAYYNNYDNRVDPYSGIRSMILPERYGSTYWYIYNEHGDARSYRDDWTPSVVHLKYVVKMAI